MPSVRHDAYGLPVTTGSGDALEAYDRAVDGLLGCDAQALDRFRTAATTDPGLALAHAGAAVCLFLDERFVEARESAKIARAVVGAQTERERSHVEALVLLVEGKPSDAEAAMTQHLADYPRDLVVFQRLYFVWFWQGKFTEMLDLSSVLTRYYPGSSFMLGLHAFALEQAGRCDEAARIARAAIEKNPRDAWSIHALAHAIYEMAAFDTGIARLPPAMALAAGGDWATADRHLGVLRARAGRDRTRLTGEVLVPLVESLHAFVAGEYRQAIERVEPLRGRIIELGGSRAQRDVFHDTLYEACFRAGDTDRAERYLAERIARRPDHYWKTRAVAGARLT